MKNAKEMARITNNAKDARQAALEKVFDHIWQDKEEALEKKMEYCASAGLTSMGVSTDEYFEAMVKINLGITSRQEICELMIEKLSQYGYAAVSASSYHRINISW